MVQPAFQRNAFQNNAFQVGDGSFQQRSPSPKAVLFHVYTSVGVVIRTWPDVVDLPTYDWPMNSGPGALRVRLPRRWSEAGEPGETGSLLDIQHGNLVKVYVVDRESGPDGVIIWQGTIARTVADLAGGLFALDLLPKTVALSDYVINTPITFTDIDPSDMALWLITSGLLPGITWDPTNPRVGLLFTLTFQKGKVSQFLDIVRGLAGGKWFVRLNPDNSLTFNQWNPAAATHRLIIGRHVAEDVLLDRSSIEVKKRVFFYGDVGILGVATVSGYDPTIGAQDEMLANVRVTDNVTALRLANAELELKSDPSIETEFSVLDSNADPDRGYDIESLKPGQTVALYNPNNVYSFPVWDPSGVWGDGDIWGGTWVAQVQRPLVIADVQYAFMHARLKLSLLPAMLPEEFAGLSDAVLITAAR